MRLRPQREGSTGVEVLVRRESAADPTAIRRVNELAFGRAAEGELVDLLRRNGALTSSWVAVDDHGEVIGHLSFSPVVIASASGSFEALGLAPMAVHPEHQCRGIGTAMICTALQALRGEGHPAVIVLGHPEYYPRFGFRRASTFGVRWEHEAPDAAFMVLELQPAALAGRGGVVSFRPEFSTV